MGLSTGQSWALTPREIIALRKVRDDAKREELQRWAIERMDFRNVHFRGESHRQEWTLVELVGPTNSPPVPPVSEEHGTFEAERMRIQALTASIKQGMVDDSMLPPFARMTAAEKEKRQIAAKALSVSPGRNR